MFRTDSVNISSKQNAVRVIWIVSAPKWRPNCYRFHQCLLGKISILGEDLQILIQAVRKIKNTIHTRKYIVWLLLGWIDMMQRDIEKLRALQSVQSLSRIQLFVTPWTAACQASQSITNSWILLKFMSIELMIPSNHLILYRPLLFLPSIFPSIRVF